MSIPIRIAIAARKGGVGKTTAAIGIAHLFASWGHNTLLADLDPQSNAAFAMGADLSAPGTAHLLLGQNPKPIQIKAKLSVLPGGPDLTDYRVSSLDADELLHCVDRMDYHTVVFDCPPGNENLERQAIVASTCALIALDAHPFAMVGAQRVLESIRLRQAKNRIAPKHVAIVG